MKAIVATAYGSPDVLQLTEVPQPTPKEHEVLIRIHASTVTTGDYEVRSFKIAHFIWLPMRLLTGITRPRKGIFGQEFAGVIAAIGSKVTRFNVGDSVFGMTGVTLGAHAEYIALPENGMLALKPANMSYDEAASIPVGGLVAAAYLRKAAIQPGEKLLINGAGGSIGTLAVQLGRFYGAHVTAVDSAPKLALLRALGADHTIDYAQSDFTQSGETYDVILDVIGKSSFSGSLSVLNPNGRYLLANPRLAPIFRGLWVSMTGSKKVIASAPISSAEELVYLKDLIESGKLKAVIDRRYPLEATAEAHRYVESGQKQGSVVITIAP